MFSLTPQTRPRALEAGAKLQAIQAALPAPVPDPAPSSTIVSILDAIHGGDLLPLVLGDGQGGFSFIQRNLSVTYPAVYRCAALIAGTLATSELYVVDPDDNIVRRKGRSQFSGARKAKRLLETLEQSLNGGLETTFETIETAGLDLALDGNAYFVIERDIRGNLDYLELASSRAVSIEGNPMTRRRIYFLQTLTGSQQMPYFDRDVIHIANTKMLARFGGNRNLTQYFGIAPAMAINSEIKTGLESNRYVRDYFTKGVGGQTFFESDRPVTEQVRNEFMDYMLKNHHTARKRHTPILVGDGIKVKAVTTEPQTSDLKDLRDQEVEEVGRAYGVPAPLIGHNITQWGSGIEHLYRIFLKFCFRFYAERLTSAFTMRLLSDGYRMKLDETNMLRGDTQANARLLKAVDGIMTRNEARRLLGLTRMADGDELLDRTPEKENNPNPMPQEDRK